MSRNCLAAVLLSLSACADLESEGIEQEPPPAAPASIDDLRAVTLSAELESKVLDVLATAKTDLFIARSAVDQLGTTHVRVRQLVKNIPVWEGEAIVHLAVDGASEVTDARVSGVDVDATPSVTSDRAEEIARSVCAACVPLTAPDLWIVKEERARLVWRVKLGGVVDRREVAPIVFVDAHDESVVRWWDNVQYATGHTQYDGTRTIPSFYMNGKYWLEDNEYNLGVYDLRSGTDPESDPYTRLYSTDNVVSRTDAAQAMYSVRGAAQYFWVTHQHWNPDGAGGPGFVRSVAANAPARLSVFIDSRFVDDSGLIYGANASWNGRLKLGRGDSEWGDLTSLDIVGHEFTHGVVEYTAGLTYMNESGALNESFADVFGAMTERYRLGESGRTWRIGEDPYTTSVEGDQLRRMDTPTSDGESVDHYSNLRTGTWDNGYVHYNSGIGNKAFHLVSEGGTHRLGGTMRGIGADRAAKIWYRALTMYLTSGSQYIDARAATQNAARDLYGYQSPEWNAVSNAWALVGIGIVSNDGFSNGNFESDYGWTFTGRAFTASGYSQSGSRHLVLGGIAATIGTATQDFAIDPYASTATISFYVNVTSTEVTKLVTDAMTIDVIDADTGASLGRLGTWTNLDRTTIGAYSYEGAFNLSHLRGRSLRLKLNATNDFENATTFRVDNIQLSVKR